MNEAVRMQYLEALGIVSYVPRLLLPNAPEATRCELPVRPPSSDLDASFSEQGREPEPGAASPGPSAISGTLADIASAVKAPVDAKATESANIVSRTTAKPELKSEPPDEETEAARFKLQLWRTDRGVQVFDSTQPGDAFPTQQLLVNILSAHDLLSTNLPTVEYQHWPMAKHPGDDQSWSAARSMLEELVSWRAQKQTMRAFIIMGSDAYRATIEQDTPFESVCYQVLHYQEKPALVLPALRDILLKPLLKQRLFTAVSQLHAEL